MTKPNPPIPALLALSVALRAARTAQGIGLRALAGKLGILPATLSAWELGTRTPPTEAIARILGFLQVRPAEYQRLMRLCHHLGSPCYVEDLCADTISLQQTYEQLAVRTLEWAPHLIPALLQTPEYTRAVLEGRANRPDDIDQEIFARQVRQIDRDRSCHHTVMLGAAALNPGSVPPPVLHAQLQVVSTAAARRNVCVHIVPASACAAGAIEPFTIYETDSKIFTVALRHQHSALYLTEPGTVKRYRSTFTALHREAIDYRVDGSGL
jgi:transcriptional regulator with XRE-family HTH domain